jgi:hypothetical protein
VAVMAASARPPDVVAAGGPEPAPTERPIRILALPPATIAPATAEPRGRTPMVAVDHLARRARPALLPSRYARIDPPTASRSTSGPPGIQETVPEPVPSRNTGPSG